MAISFLFHEIDTCDCDTSHERRGGGGHDWTVSCLTLWLSPCQLTLQRLSLTSISFIRTIISYNYHRGGRPGTSLDLVWSSIKVTRPTPSPGSVRQSGQCNCSLTSSYLWFLYTAANAAQWKTFLYCHNSLKSKIMGNLLRSTRNFTNVHRFSFQLILTARRQKALAVVGS